MIEAAIAGDLPQVHRLLEQHHLPLDGVDEHVGTMLVAREGSQVIGAAALELYADGALLRSVAVDTARQGRHLGHQLTGFEQIARDEVPLSVQASVEFTSACPASAIVMRKRLAK